MFKKCVKSFCTFCRCLSFVHVLMSVKGNYCSKSTKYITILCLMFWFRHSRWDFHLNCENIFKYAEWLDFRSKFFLTIETTLRFVKVLEFKKPGNPSHCILRDQAVYEMGYLKLSLVNHFAKSLYINSFLKFVKSSLRTNINMLTIWMCKVCLYKHTNFRTQTKIARLISKCQYFPF